MFWMRSRICCLCVRWLNSNFVRIGNTKGFFIAHPWQIVLGSHSTECLYCSICISLARFCNPQRESISCARCPFTSLIFTFSPIPYLYLLVSPILCSFFSLYFLKARIFIILPSLYLFIFVFHFLHSFPHPLLNVALLSCPLVLLLLAVSRNP